MLSGATLCWNWLLWEDWCGIFTDRRVQIHTLFTHHTHSSTLVHWTTDSLSTDRDRLTGITGKYIWIFRRSLISRMSFQHWSVMIMETNFCAFIFHAKTKPVPEQLLSQGCQVASQNTETKTHSKLSSTGSGNPFLGGADMVGYTKRSLFSHRQTMIDWKLKMGPCFNFNLSNDNKISQAKRHALQISISSLENVTINDRTHKVF